MPKCACGCGLECTKTWKRGHAPGSRTPLYEVRSDGCWIWLRARNERYGMAHTANRRTILAHRWMYERAVGPIPTGLVLDHLCQQTFCVNPAHLEPVTQGENIRRGWALRRWTHCRKGHPFDEANTYRLGSRRFCRACQNAATKRYQERKKAAL